MHRRPHFLLNIGAILLCLVWTTSYSQVSFEEAFSELNFNFPVEIQNANDGTDRLFVVEQPGMIKVFPNNENVNTNEVSTFLDIRNTVSYSAGQEIGLLGLAFHPQFSSNRYVFVYYIDRPSNYRINIARYQVDAGDQNRVDPSTELIIARYAKNQADSNHNGGKIAFGPDGYLYASIGDGGGGGDPQGNGQNLNTVFGSIIRLDIDVNGDNPAETNPEAPNGNYEIPSDNPRVGQNGLDELYAWGIRNTWKFSFDQAGRLWGGDVGQNTFEEINIVERGGNYGWNRFEANSQPSYGQNTTLATNPDIKPIFFYDHNQGDVSITGGYVYQGSLTDETIQNRYIYADYVSGRVWALSYNSSNGSIENDLLFQTNGQFVSSFGEDEAGELYFSNYGNSVKLYKITETVAEPTTTAVNGVGEWKTLGNGINGTVETLFEAEDGSVYAGGEFTNADGTQVNNLARLTTDEQWQAVSNGSNGPINAIAQAPNGDIYVGGEFTEIGGVAANNVAYYDGTSWNSLNTGTNGLVAELKFDDSGALYVGGVFTQAGGTNVNYIAQWNNNTWSALTDSFTGVSGTNNEIRSIAIDANNHIYVGGNFDTAGDTTAPRIARWDGSTWGSLGNGTSGFVQAIEINNGFLYAAGNFALAENQTVNRIARWNLANGGWQSLNQGVSGNINALISNGEFIYAAGSFETARDVDNVNEIMRNISRWSEVNGWEALGPGTNVGVNSRINALAFFKNNTELLVGGNFSQAASTNANNIAVWGTSFCTDESVIPEYQINGVWQSGENSISITTGDTLILSILPNGPNFTIVLPNGETVNGDYSLGAVDINDTGTYNFTTAAGCSASLSITVSESESPDEDNDGVLDNLDNCPNTPEGETVNDEGCSDSQLDGDDDNDGIANSLDQCPNTAEGATVNTEGCSEAQLDDDNDGVANSLDQCPNTAEGATVNSEGCSDSQLDGDDDNDGVANSLDQCPSTPQGETVNAQGCGDSQLDDDTDGISNLLDTCPNTPIGVTVDNNGCEVLDSLPTNNFTINSVGTSCIGVSDGQIILVALEELTYMASITGEGSSRSIPFTDGFTLENLPSGTYNICITAEEIQNYEYCSSAIVQAPEALSVTTTINGLSEELGVNLSGSTKYFITFNNTSFATTESKIVLPLQSEINTLQVSTSQDCLGSFDDTIIYLKEALVYPNPFNEALKINAAVFDAGDISVSIYNILGQVQYVETLTKNIESELIVSTENLRNGLYMVNLSQNGITRTLKLLKE